MVVPQPVDQHMDVLALQEACGLVAYDVGEMGDDHRRSVDDRCAGGSCLFSSMVRHPVGGETEDGLGGLSSTEDAELAAVAGGERHDFAAWGFRLGDAHAVEMHAVATGWQADIVPCTYQGHHEAEFLRDLATEGFDTIQQIAAAFLIDEVEGVVGEMEFEGLDAHRADDCFGIVGVEFDHRHFVHDLVVGGNGHAGREHVQGGGHGDEGDFREAGQQGEAADNEARDTKGPSSLEQLLADFGAEVPVGTDPGDQQAGADGSQ